MSEPWTEEKAAALKTSAIQMAGSSYFPCRAIAAGLLAALAEIERLRAEMKKKGEMTQGLLFQQQDFARRVVALLQPFTGLSAPDFAQEREGWQTQVASLRLEIERLREELASR